MSKLPTKQIYLLFIIVMGIISLSVYSTYAIFTFESETSDIVNLYTPNSLEISTDVYEYKQVTVPKNSRITTDIDIYNTHEYELCYSIWYKVVNNKIDSTKVSVFQNTDKNLDASGFITSMNSRRISLLIINNNDSDVKVNIGLSSSKNEGTCKLNISEDKSTITQTVYEPMELSKTIIKNLGKKNNEEGYLTHKNIETSIELKDKIYISNEFTYHEEVFTLKNPLEVELKDLEKYVSTETESYYTCLDNKTCKTLYKINEIEKQNDEATKEIDYYRIVNVDKLSGYLNGEVGVKELTQNNNKNYIYYGDNPNNYIYYNCEKESDNRTCELWRIIGTYFDSSTKKYVTKIIKNDYLKKITYSDELNTWNNSNVSKYLNQEYKIDDKYITEFKFNQENIPSLELNLDKIEIKPVEKATKVGLMNITDYLNASTCNNKQINQYDEKCLNNNWLNLNNDLYEWTNSVKYEEIVIEEKQTEEPIEEENTELQDETTTEETTEEEIIIPKNNTIYSVGSTIKETNVSTELNIRPVVYLKSEVLLITGKGTFEDPYVIR